MFTLWMVPSQTQMPSVTPCWICFCDFHFSHSVMSKLFATPWTAARLASLSITNSQHLLKLTSIESVTPSGHLTLWRPLLLPPSVFPSARGSSRESGFSLPVPSLHGKQTGKQWESTGDQSPGASAPASVLPVNTQDWSHLGWTGWISLQSKGLSRVFSNTAVQMHQLSLWSDSHIHT